MAQVELVWTNVDSSNVRSVAYDEDSETLAVHFLNGYLYSYDGPDHEVYVGLVHALSVGEYLNNAVKGLYPYTRHSSEQELLDHISSRRK